MTMRLGRLAYPLIDSLPESSFAYMVQWRCDTMRPNKFVDIEVLITTDSILILDSILDHKHLQAAQIS